MGLNQTILHDNISKKKILLKSSSAKT